MVIFCEYLKLFPSLDEIFGIQKLAQLKRQLTKERELSKVRNFYRDEFSDHPEFLEFGDLGPSPFNLFIKNN